ncbi:hypothetical protein [Promicromonospora soli]
MPARSGRAGVIVGTLIVGYLGAIALGSYVVGGAVIDAMRAQQTADVVATLPGQEIVLATVAQERALATVIDQACAPATPDCAAARMALLNGVPERDQNGEPVVGDDGEVTFAAPSALQQTVTALDRRDQGLAGLDVEMLDAPVRDAIERTAGDRAAIDQVHDAIETSPGQAVEAYDQYLQNATGVSTALAEATDGELRARLEAQRLLTELTLANPQERTLVVLSLGTFAVGLPGNLEPAAAEVTAIDEQVAEAQAALGRTGSDQQIPPIDGDLAQIRSAVLSGELDGLTPAQAQGFPSASAAWGEQVRQVRDAVRTETLELAGNQASAATNRALLTGGITVTVLVLALVAVIVVSVLLLRRRRTPTPPPSAWSQPAVSVAQR